MARPKAFIRPLRAAGISLAIPAETQKEIPNRLIRISPGSSLLRSRNSAAGLEDWPTEIPNGRRNWVCRYALFNFL